MASKSFLLVSLAFILLCGCQAELVNDICSATSNPYLCNQVLRSDPRSRGAKIPRDLGPIALDKALEGTKAALQVVISIGKGPAASTCIQVIQLAVDILKNCRPLLKASDKFTIRNLQTYALGALTDVGICDNSYKNVGKEPPQINQASQTAQGLIDILLVIAKHL